MTDSASLPQLIAELIRNCEGSDAQLRDPEEIIRMVTTQLATSPNVKTKANWSWAIRTCVRIVYADLRHKSRVPASKLDERRSQDEQIVMPGWDEVVKWRETFENGLEIAVAYATLAQLEVAASRYAKLGRENLTKGRYFAALADAMRARGFRAEQTVEEFYRTQAA